MKKEAVTIKSLDEDKCLVCGEESDIGIHGIRTSMYLCHTHYYQTKRNTDFEIKLRETYYAIKKSKERTENAMVV